MHKTILFIVLLILLTNTLSIKSKKSIKKNKTDRRNSFELPTLNVNIHLVSQLHSSPSFESYPSYSSLDSYNYNEDHYYGGEDNYYQNATDVNYNENYREGTSGPSGFLKTSSKKKWGMNPLLNESLSSY